MDINPNDETSYTNQYQQAFGKYVGNKYWAEHRQMSVSKPKNVPHGNIFPSAKTSALCQSSDDPYDLFSIDVEYLTPESVVETTPGQSNHAACLLTAARLHLNSPPEAPQHWGQINPNLNDYHSIPIEISSTSWLPDITDWWCQPEETHSEFPNLSNVACNIISIISHGVVVEASCSLGRDVIGWRQSKTTGEMLQEEVVLRQCARANEGILAGG